MIGRIGRTIKEKICEDLRVLAMMCIGKMAGCVVLSRFFHLTGKGGDTVCTEYGRVLYLRICLPYVRLALFVAGYR